MNPGTILPDGRITWFFSNPEIQNHADEWQEDNNGNPEQFFTRTDRTFQTIVDGYDVKYKYDEFYKTK